MTTSTDRLHYMDNLRALVMIAGVFFHAALAYSPHLNQLWMSADTVTSPAVDWVVNFMHVFRMPLFFAIAGFFAALLVSRRGVGRMLKNRAVRVLIPFVIFWPIVMAGIVVPMLWAVNNVDNLSPFLQMMRPMMIGEAPPESTPPSTVHLWFLYYLMYFYCLVWILGQAPLDRVKAFFLQLSPLAAVCILPLCLVPGLFLGLVPYPAPEGFIPQPWAFGFFGLFFAYGYWMFDSMKLIDAFERYWWVLVLISVGLYIPFYQSFPDSMSFEYKNPPLMQHSILVFCTAYIAVFMSIACLVLARKLLDKRNAFMRYMSDASYWIYIVHLPVVVGIQYWLLDQTGGWLYKFSVSSLATMAFCVLTYMLLVRWTPLGWLLNGRRKPVFRSEPVPAFITGSGQK